MAWKPERVQAVLFDVDGTLSDTDDAYIRSISRFVPPWLFREPEGVARRVVMWLEAPGNGLLTIADRLGLDDEMMAAIDWMYRRRRKKWRNYLIVPGVEQMLQRLQGRYKLGVVSARTESRTREFLDHFDLLKYFGAVITVLSTERTKPFPDPVLLAARKLGVAPEACVMVGDTTVDIRAGRAAGTQAVGVLCGFGERAELVRSGADLVLPSTTDLAEALLGRAA